MCMLLILLLLNVTTTLSAQRVVPFGEGIHRATIVFGRAR